MRNIVNISLPVQLTKEVDRGVKQMHFASKSEFFRHLIRDWMAGRLLVDLQTSEREYRAGKGKRLKNPQQLWK